MTDPAVLRKQLVDRLVTAGALRSNQWQKVFGIVPRHVFLHRFFICTDDGMRYVAVDSSDPGWLDLVYRDQAWTTQLDGDDHMWKTARRQGPIPGMPTSSSSQPSLMAAMLESLEVQEGNRVLEIGAGTGYNAALLSERLGDSHVVSIDIDPTLITRATDCLTRAGYRPTIALADGTGARAPGAPFDRLIATVAVGTIPLVWLDQVQPGGLILANLDSDLSGGALVCLTVKDDGSACGHFDSTPALFMPTRAQPLNDSAALFRKVLRDPGAGAAGRTELDPSILTEGEFLFFASLQLPDVSSMGFTPTDGESQEWLLARDGSWAYCTASGATSQAGNRKLWDELEVIANQWQQLGQPARHRFGLTVTTDNTHRLWLGNPETPHTWMLSKGSTAEQLS